ncbi:MAG: hypothetical protein RL693_1461 [Verrucomicrobiota bacterium]
MKYRLTALLSLISISITAGFAQTPATPAFEFKDNDRVVLLGGTLIEREQKFGYLESALALATGDKHLTVRNLGWSGDTVFGHARSYFGPPQEGLDRLAKHLEMIKPTVLITSYGADMPFEGLLKMPDFITGYRTLLDLARSISPNVRIIIVSPPPLENLGPPLPDLNEANNRLASVNLALKEFAAKQSAHFADAFTLMGGAQKERPARPLTDNGIHYGKDGYRVWAGKIIEGLGLPKIDLEAPSLEPLRTAVIKKDRLFFDRWRPANETYLYGFRKHEQGKNAAEIEQFDPLVEAQDKKIYELKSALLQGAKKLP